MNIFFGILSVYVLYLLVDALQMHLLSQILGQFIGVGVLALIVVFQQEIRRFLLFIGSTTMNNRMKFLKKLLPRQWEYMPRTATDLQAIKQAVISLQSSHTGALLVFLKNSELKNYQRTGTVIDAKVSAPLIQSIFFRNSPLHDGAIMIKDNRILAAGCILPISERTDFPVYLGLRHRAAVGVTELSDVVAVVVSEETGKLSIASNGVLDTCDSVEDFIRKLDRRLKT